MSLPLLIRTDPVAISLSVRSIVRVARPRMGVLSGNKGDWEMLVGRWRLVKWGVCSTLMVLLLGVQASVAIGAGYEFKRAFGPDGSSLTGFSTAGSVAVDQEEETVYVLDRAAGALFKFDFEGNPIALGGSGSNISGNELSGLSIGGGAGERQVAVDSSRHIVYLTGGETLERATALQAFQANGEPSLFVAGPGAGTNEITGFPGLRGVAVDSSGSIYLSGTKEGAIGNDISIYSAAGSLLVPSVDGALLGPGNIAVDSNGALYVLRNSVELARYIPSEFPVTSLTTYSASLERVDPRAGQSVAVDPLTNRVFVTEAFEEEGSLVSQVAIFNEDGTPEGIFAGPGEPGQLELADGIAIGVVGDIARPFVADNPDVGLPQVKIFQEEVTVAAPSIESTAVTDVTGDSATLRAKINPNKRSTAYWFEYGLADCMFSSCTKVPLALTNIGDGRKGIIVTQPIAGLQSQVTYYYRVVASNELGKLEGPSKTFTTQGTGLGFQLSDSRVWEMVSPANKFNGSVITDDSAIIQAADSGEALAYSSLGSVVADPVSSRSPQPATVLAKRNEHGKWISEDLSPPLSEATLVSGDSEFKLFTPSLLHAVMEPTDETQLSPDASEQTPYLWSDGSSPLFTPMVNPENVGPGIVFGPSKSGSPSGKTIAVEGASPDLAHVVIRSEIPLFKDAEPQAVYMWSGGDLDPVSELPEAEGGSVVLGILGSGQGSVRHAVSRDGSRVFWAPTNAYNSSGINLPSLYLRDTVAGRSVRLDVAKLGASELGAEKPAFNAASADGSVMFFTDSQQLTVGASPSGRDLYRCVIGPVEGGLGCAELTDISAPLEGSGESADVLDQVSGVSEDGERLYFVARGVLNGAPNDEGKVASRGEPNLYFWQAGQGTKFIATLSGRDAPVWGGFPGSQGYAERISAAASPNGRFFAFTSERSLTGYENRNDSDQPTTEVFVYDSEAKANQLTCISCIPSGAAAAGERLTGKVNFPPDPAGLWAKRWVAATLPEASKTQPVGRSLYLPHYVLDDGRVFFNSVDPLVPADSNGNWDVYDYQPVGVGTCASSTSTAGVSRTGSGCVGLVSSGTADGDAGFLDATPSGGDIFFVTPGRLSALDLDDEMDVYDARVNGIPAVLNPIQECVGEACQPSVGPPSDPTAASEAFRGAETPLKCRKGQRKVRRNGRRVCVRKKSTKRGKHQIKRAGKNGRAGR